MMSRDFDGAAAAPLLDDPRTWSDTLHAMAQGAQAKAANLRRRADGPDGVAGLALDQLDLTIEELETANEELRRQNEALEELQAELARQRQEYMDLFESAPVAYLVTDAAGRISRANRAAAELLGVQPQFLAGKPLLVFVSGEERVAVARGLADAASRQGPVRDWPLRLQPRGRLPVDVEAQIEPAPRLAGEPREFRWVLQEMTAKSVLRDELHRSRELFAAVSRAAHFPVVAVDEHGTVTSWNPAAERRFGWLREEVLGRRVPLRTEEGERVLPIAPEAMTERRDCVSVQRQDGRSVQADLTTVPLRGASGEITGLAAVFGA